MKRRIEKYIDNLFDDIYETNQLRELKEEIASNLLEKINDFIAKGDSEEEAFNKGVSSLGNMDELVGNLKKASEAKLQENFLKPKSLDRKHVIGYVSASTILLFGLITAGTIYSQIKNLLIAAWAFIPFLVVSASFFVYLGLTQDTLQDYGMKAKRALAYSLASGASLAGIFIPILLYYNGNKPFEVLFTIVIFCVPSVIAFIYLGLTEKSRKKINEMDPKWQKQWLEYYSNPQSKMVRSTLSSAIWIFATAFFLLSLILGLRFSWIVFIFAAGVQALIEAHFQSKNRR